MAALYDALGNYIGDDGLDPPVKTLQQTQATSPAVPPGVNNGVNTVVKAVPKVTVGGIGFGAGNSEFGDDPPQAPTDGGAGSEEDSGQGGGQGVDSTTTKEVNLNANLVNEEIKPRPNVLDKFSSYTYRASVYLVTPQQYNQLLVSKKKTVNGYQLLFQSGGAPINSGGFRGSSATGDANNTIPGANQPDAGRNPAFPQDFYIESISIENLFPGKATRAAHATASIKFTVVEPMGITLIDRLYQAVQDFIPKDGAGAVNYNAVTYMMVIRWYGYDQNGKLIERIGDPNSSDPNAVIEKFIPFRITKLDWRVDGKLVNYQFEGAPVGMMIAAGTRRGTIPYDVQPNAKTVGELLGGNLNFVDNTIVDPANPGQSTTASSEDEARDAEGSSNPPPPKANAAASASKTIKQGLMGAMNEFQKELTVGKNAVYTYPDTYKIKFAKGAEKIRDAMLQLPGKEKEAKQGPLAAPTAQSVQSASPERIAKDNSSRNFSITAGMQLVQVIDLAIRNSSYILDQELTLLEDGKEVPNKKAEGKPVQWYNISFQAKQGKYDELRNDHAFEITFIISAYTIPNYNSKYFPMTKFRGVHKSYEYWFTGHNTAVLEYKEELNTLYHITVTASNPKTSLAEKQRRELTSSMREIPFYTYQAASTESRQGSESNELEGTANLAEDLYSPSDLARTTLKIIGDPAWMQQGSHAGGVDAENFNYSPFLPDGTINFDASQVLFEIAWQRPQDYDLTTGLADPYSNRKNKSREPGQSRVYQATRVINEFNNGKFEQIIEGVLYLFLKPNATNKSAGASVPGAQADARRVDNAIDAQQNSGRTSADSETPAAGDYGDAFSSTASAPNQALIPAPTLPSSPVTENNTQTDTAPAPPLVPQLPPLPTTDGTGLGVGFDQFLLRPKKINLSTDAVPSEPQTMAPPDP